MVALDFPDAPTNGQVFDKWTWNGTAWVLTTANDPSSWSITKTPVLATQTIPNASFARIRFVNDGRRIIQAGDWTFDDVNWAIGCNRAGTYDIGFQVSFSAPAAATYVQARMYLASSVVFEAIASTAGGFASVTASDVMAVPAGGVVFFDIGTGGSSSGAVRLGSIWLNRVGT